MSNFLTNFVKCLDVKKKSILDFTPSVLNRSPVGELVDFQITSSLSTR